MYHKKTSICLIILLFVQGTCLIGWSQPQSKNERFWFGSYGRVGISWDSAGGQGQPLGITPYRPRLIEDNYLELDFGYHAYRSKLINVDTVMTLSFFDQFFHYDGNADSHLAIRRAFVEATGLGGGHLFLSVGSRWLRGNDIYLLNFWPLDDLNTMGLTVGHRTASSDAYLHVGVSRLIKGKQVQYVDVPAVDNFGADSILFLNRQRTIAALLYEKRYARSTQNQNLKSGGWKWKLYGEFHMLPEGERALEGGYSETETLSNDQGLLVGAQLGFWGMRHQFDHLNIWLRYAQGLAVFDELGAPSSFNFDRRSWDAKEVRLALAGNHVFGKMSLQWGGYWRYYRDADQLTVDYDDRSEGSISVRPQLNLGFFTPAIELSMQGSQALGFHPDPLRSTQDPAFIYQGALIPAFSFGKKSEIGSFTRPQIRLIYALSYLNQEARARYAQLDPRSQETLVHYIGTRAEWWFGRGGGY
jgi:maltoporin